LEYAGLKKLFVSEPPRFVIGIVKNIDSKGGQPWHGLVEIFQIMVWNGEVDLSPTAAYVLEKLEDQMGLHVFTGDLQVDRFIRGTSEEGFDELGGAEGWLRGIPQLDG
jgi:hypothetical protein